MKCILAVAAAALILGGCGREYDGRYTIDSIRMMSEGPRVTEPVSETYPLDAWFEIESGKQLRVHAAGVTSTYKTAKFLKTDAGFDAVTENPRGAGVLSWSFEKGGEDGICCLTFTHDGIHYLKMTSKGRATG